MTDSLTIGYSPCPNDTYIFYALTHKKIPLPGITLATPYLEDVETLNRLAIKKKLDITKLSFHALAHVLDEYCLLHCGAALGRGCGPLLVSRSGISMNDIAGGSIAIPGKFTTANMLFRLYSPDTENLIEMRFDRIIPAVMNGEVDAGVIIHESRFTYRDHGLICIQDLGQWWEESSGHPIPLGCIAARRALGTTRIKTIENAIGQSISYADSHTQECFPYIHQYAQEMEQQVMQNHITLYVNEYSKGLGSDGLAAVEAFFARGSEAGILPQSIQSPLL